MRGVVCAVFLCAAFTAWSCKDTAPTGPGGSPSTIIFPDHNISYASQVQPLFDQACNASGCHDNTPHESALVLTSYGLAVLTIPGVVVPGKPDASTLVLRIQGSVGTRMPPGAYPLNQNQINGIRTWIAEGAKNN